MLKFGRARPSQAGAFLKDAFGLAAHDRLLAYLRLPGGLAFRVHFEMRTASVIIALTALAGCASTPRDQTSMTDAHLVDPLALQSRYAAPVSSEYLIGPTDLLRLTVFQVPDLSFEEIRVDSAGNLNLPLIGSVVAAGKSPIQLSSEIENRLGERFLRNPRVSITVSEAASQKVTVDGAVTKPGVYLMRGRTTLLQALAMAEGATRVADLEQIAVFRMDGDRRQVAVFDLAAIRGGQAPDPVLRGDDVVVVDTSRLSAVWRDTLATLPALSVFAYVR